MLKGVCSVYGMGQSASKGRQRSGQDLINNSPGMRAAERTPEGDGSLTPIYDVLRRQLVHGDQPEPAPLALVPTTRSSAPVESIEESDLDAPTMPSRTLSLGSVIPIRRLPFSGGRHCV